MAFNRKRNVCHFVSTTLDFKLVLPQEKNIYLQVVFYLILYFLEM